MLTHANVVRGAALVILAVIFAVGPTIQAQNASDPGLPDSILVSFNNDPWIECNHPDDLNKSVSIWVKTDDSLSGLEYRIEIVSADSAQVAVDGYYHWGLTSDWLPNIETETYSDGILPDTVVIHRWAENIDQCFPDRSETEYAYPWSASRIDFSCITTGNIIIRNLDGGTKLWDVHHDPHSDDYYLPAFPERIIGVIEIDPGIIEDPGEPDQITVSDAEVGIGVSAPVPIRITNDEDVYGIAIKLITRTESGASEGSIVTFDSVVYTGPLADPGVLENRYCIWRDYELNDGIDTLNIALFTTGSGSPLSAGTDEALVVPYFSGLEEGEVTIELAAPNWCKFWPTTRQDNDEYFYPVFTPGHLTVATGTGGPGDSGARDTLRVENGELYLGETSPVVVSLFNDELIQSVNFNVLISTSDGANVEFDSLHWVGRMADPLVAAFRGVSYAGHDGVLPDSVNVFALGITGNHVIEGDGPIAELFFTGTTGGELQMEFFDLGGADVTVPTSLRVADGNRFVPVLKAATVQVGDPPPPAPVFEPALSEPEPVIVGGTVEFDVLASSPVDNPVTVSLASLTTYDDAAAQPASAPLFDASSFQWTPSAEDIGVWQATFEAVDDISGGTTIANVRIQVIESDAYRVTFNVETTPDAQHASGIVHGDYDHDNAPEILMSSVSWGTGKSLGVYDYPGGGGLEEVFALYEDYPNAGIASGYFDSDDNLDAVSCMFRTLWVYQGNGDNTFLVADNNEDRPTGNVQGATLTNFNGDGLLDYVVATTEDVWVYTGTPDMLFTQAVALSTPSVPMSVNSADFDGDGWDDLAVGVAEGLQIYINDTQGGYTEGDFYSQTFGTLDIDVTNQGSDFNNDGIFDLCLATPSFGTPNSEIMVYLGAGDGTFEQRLVRSVRGTIHVNQTGDFNGDTELDIAYINGTERYLAILFGDGGGNFPNELRYDIADYTPYQLDCLDIDNDGDLDAVVSAYHMEYADFASALYLYLNELDPQGVVGSSLNVNLRNDAAIELEAPNGARLSEVANAIPSASLHRRNLDGDNYLDLTAAMSAAVAGRYDMKVTPRSGFAGDQTFSLDYTLNGEKHLIARNLPISGDGYVFPIYPVGQSGIVPAQGKFLPDAHPLFEWDTTAVPTIEHQSSLPFSDQRYDFRLAADIQFAGVIETAVATGGSYTLQTALDIADTTTYFWQVRLEGETDWGPVYVFNTVASFGCCIGRVGDANGADGDEPSIGDVSSMIDALFISGNAEPLGCLGEADINQSGGPSPTYEDISVGDISILIDYLFITGHTLGLPDCL